MRSHDLCPNIENVLAVLFCILAADPNSKKPIVLNREDPCHVGHIIVLQAEEGHLHVRVSLKHTTECAFH